MTLLPEGLSSRRIATIIELAYEDLSDFRGYEVVPGHPVCAFIAPSIVNLLSEDNYSATVFKITLADGTGNWVVEFDNGTKLDATWLSMLPPDIWDDLPTSLLYTSPNDAIGLNGEKISSNVLNQYFTQLDLIKANV